MLFVSRFDALDHFFTLRNMVIGPSDSHYFRSMIAEFGWRNREDFAAHLEEQKIHGLVFKRGGFYDIQAWLFFRVIEATRTQKSYIEILEIGHHGNRAPWDAAEPEALWNGTSLVQALKAFECPEEPEEIRYTYVVPRRAEASQRFRVISFFTNWGFDLLDDVAAPKLQFRLAINGELSNRYSRVTRQILKVFPDGAESMRGAFAILPGAFAEKSEFLAFCEALLRRLELGEPIHRPLVISTDRQLISLNARLPSLQGGGVRAQLITALYAKLVADRRLDRADQTLTTLMQLQVFPCDGQLYVGGKVPLDE